VQRPAANAISRVIPSPLRLRTHVYNTPVYLSLETIRIRVHAFSCRSNGFFTFNYCAIFFSVRRALYVPRTMSRCFAQQMFPLARAGLSNILIFYVRNETSFRYTTSRRPPRANDRRALLLTQQWHVIQSRRPMGWNDDGMGRRNLNAFEYLVNLCVCVENGFVYCALFSSLE
jgi:hypothetical protein